MTLMDTMPAIFSALSDPCRLSIVESLMREGETTAGDIVDRYDISGPAISRHLSVLRNAGLVSQRISGKHRLYSVRPAAIREVADWSLDHRAFWEASIDRIEAALREDE